MRHISYRRATFAVRYARSAWLLLRNQRTLSYTPLWRMRHLKASPPRLFPTRVARCLDYVIIHHHSRCFKINEQHDCMGLTSALLGGSCSESTLQHSAAYASSLPQHAVYRITRHSLCRTELWPCLCSLLTLLLCTIQTRHTLYSIDQSMIAVKAHACPRTLYQSVLT